MNYMTPEEVAPPFESWPVHLKALADNDLVELAGDYRWLDNEARPQQERDEFRTRRGAIIAACERRGLGRLADACRPAR